jgi:hypothetical protein
VYDWEGFAGSWVIKNWIFIYVYGIFKKINLHFYVSRTKDFSGDFCDCFL